ncbi:hypothetical protein [Aneurinibacillus soli]|nr:hypothetical protein [Aneurinibacillus soli]
MRANTQKEAIVQKNNKIVAEKAPCLSNQTPKKTESEKSKETKAL